MVLLTKKNELFIPDIDELSYILNDTIEDSRKNIFIHLDLVVYMTLKAKIRKMRRKSF